MTDARTPRKLHYKVEPKVDFSDLPERVSNSSSKQPYVPPKWGRPNQQVPSRGTPT